MPTIIDPDGTPVVIYNREDVTVASITAAPSTPTAIPHHSRYTIVRVGLPTGNWGVQLPADAEVGDVVELYAQANNTLVVYPDSGSQINFQGVDTSLTIRCGIFRKVADNNWGAVIQL